MATNFNTLSNTDLITKNSPSYTWLQKKLGLHKAPLPKSAGKSKLLLNLTLPPLPQSFICPFFYLSVRHHFKFILKTSFHKDITTNGHKLSLRLIRVSSGVLVQSSRNLSTLSYITRALGKTTNNQSPDRLKPTPNCTDTFATTAAISEDDMVSACGGGVFNIACLARR